MNPPPLEKVEQQEAAPVFSAPLPDAPDDFFAFCKKVNPREFEKIIKEGQLIQYGANSVVYSQGEASDSFYVVNDGTVEIVVVDQEGQNPIPITYLTKGDLFGEIGLLINTPRTATVCVPESAALLRFDQKAFQHLMATIPTFGYYLIVLLAHRLYKTTTQLHFRSNVRELSGSLDFFDLPTVFQTISLSQQHGIMNVVGPANEMVGEFAFANGTPISARFEHLYGMEALLQFFLITPKTFFGFTRTVEPPTVESSLAIPNINEFTMNAVHLKDEMLALEKKLNLSEEQPVKRVHASLHWQYPDFQECARELWQALTKEPLPMKELSSKLPYCRYHLLQVLDRLFETKQLAYAEITPYGYR